jgi:hypothetical protein
MSLADISERNRHLKRWSWQEEIIRLSLVSFTNVFHQLVRFPSSPSVSLRFPDNKAETRCRTRPHSLTILVLPCHPASSYPENYVTQFGERLLNAPSDIEYRDVTIEVFHMLRGVLDSDEVKQRFRNLRFKCRAEESLDGYMLARKLKSSTLCPERSHKGAKQPSEQG